MVTAWILEWGGLLLDALGAHTVGETLRRCCSILFPLTKSVEAYPSGAGTVTACPWLLCWIWSESRSCALEYRDLLTKGLNQWLSSPPSWDHGISSVNGRFLNVSTQATMFTGTSVTMQLTFFPIRVAFASVIWAVGGPWGTWPCPEGWMRASTLRSHSSIVAHQLQRFDIAFWKACQESI